MNLYIDTSCDITSIGLVGEDGHFIFSEQFPGQQNQSEELLGRIDQMLKKYTQDIKTISNIILVIGPGSYTGLRVGVSSANAIALAIGCGIISISQNERDEKLKKIDLPGSAEFKPAAVIYKNPPHITVAKTRQNSSQTIK